MPKPVGAKELKARITRSPCGVYFFFGEEEHLKRVYLARFRALITENPSFNLAKLDFAGEASIGRLSEEVAVLPFLSELRLIEVHGFPFLQLSDADERRFMELLSGVSEGVILVFAFSDSEIPFAPKLQSRTVYKHLPENVTVVNFTHPSAQELRLYYQGKFNTAAVQITADALACLIERCETDMMRLEQETDVLISYARAKEKSVDAAMVDEFVPESIQTALWHFSDAIENADEKRALTEYQKLRASRTAEPIQIAATIARALGNLRACKYADSKTAVTLCGVRDFRYRALHARAVTVSDEALAQAALLCLEADERLKNTAIDADLLVQELAVRICRVLKG